MKDAKQNLSCSKFVLLLLLKSKQRYLIISRNLLRGIVLLNNRKPQTLSLILLIGKFLSPIAPQAIIKPTNLSKSSKLIVQLKFFCDSLCFSFSAFSYVSQPRLIDKYSQRRKRIVEIYSGYRVCSRPWTYFDNILYLHTALRKLRKIQYLPTRSISTNYFFISCSNDFTWAFIIFITGARLITRLSSIHGILNWQGRRM